MAHCNRYSAFDPLKRSKTGAIVKNKSYKTIEARKLSQTLRTRKHRLKQKLLAQAKTSTEDLEVNPFDDDAVSLVVRQQYLEREKAKLSRKPAYTVRPSQVTRVEVRFSSNLSLVKKF